MLLEGKNALITGAARGIGAAMVEVFAREGANVWAFARTPDARFEARLAMAAGKYGVWIKPVYCELTDTAALKEAFRQVMADKQPLHVLVNNAGIMGEDRMFQMTSAEDMRRIMDVNFFAMVEVSRLATRLMARNKCGAVVNIASVAAPMPRAAPVISAFFPSKSMLFPLRSRDLLLFVILRVQAEHIIEVVRVQRVAHEGVRHVFHRREHGPGVFRVVHGGVARVHGRVVGRCLPGHQ